jgi:DNA-binding GntR family transcriptional regulator
VQAAQNRDDSDLLSITRAEEAMRAESLSQRPDLPRAVELNKTFHFAVYDAAHSPILMEIIRALWLKAGPVINLDLRANPERLAKGDAIRFHANVRKAIAAGDEAAAQAGIAADISGAAEVILSRGGLAG